MMLSLIYVSSALAMMSKNELLDVLKVSKRNNALLGVTGMLLYKGGNFMQVIEGPEDSIMQLFSKIEADERHKDIIVISKEEIDERQFADWKMAFVNLDDEAIRNEPAFSNFLKDDLTAEKYRKDPQFASIMLLSFRDSVR